jgi:hypothetical protein
MTTLTLNTASAGLAGRGRHAPRKGFWTVLKEAIIASRQRQAEIEIRRIEAMMGRRLRVETPEEAYALLPFRGE